MKNKKRPASPRKPRKQVEPQWGWTIKFRRAKGGRTLKEIAAAARISTGTLSNALSKGRPPRERGRVAKAVGLTSDYLFDEEDSPRSSLIHLADEPEAAKAILLLVSEALQEGARRMGEGEPIGRAIAKRIRKPKLDKAAG